jgi:hypothetical protein
MSGRCVRQPRRDREESATSVRLAATAVSAVSPLLASDEFTPPGRSKPTDAQIDSNRRKEDLMPAQDRSRLVRD